MNEGMDRNLEINEQEQMAAEDVQNTAQELRDDVAEALDESQEQEANGTNYVELKTTPSHAAKQKEGNILETLLPYLTILFVAISMIVCFNLNKNIKSLEQKVTDYQNTVSSMEGEIRSLKDELSVKDESLSAANEDLTATRDQLAVTEESLAQAFETNETLQSTVDEINEKAEELQATIDAVKAKIKEQSENAVASGDIANKDFWNAKAEEANASKEKFATLLKGFEEFAGTEEEAVEETTEEAAEPAKEEAAEASVEEKEVIEIKKDTEKDAAAEEEAEEPAAETEEPAETEETEEPKSVSAADVEKVILLLRQYQASK